MSDFTFYQQLVLTLSPVIITSVFAGILVPYIFKRIDTEKSKAMLALEDRLKRQAKILDSQSTLVDSLTTAIWKWRYLITRVTYTGALGTEKALNKSWKIYESQMWDSLGSVKIEISRSRRLISDTSYNELNKIYSKMVELDRGLSAAMELDELARKRELEDLNNTIITNLSNKIDQSLHKVAGELNLVTTII